VVRARNRRGFLPTQIFHDGLHAAGRCSSRSEWMEATPQSRHSRFTTGRRITSAGRPIFFPGRLPTQLTPEPSVGYRRSRVLRINQQTGAIQQAYLPIGSKQFWKHPRTWGPCSLTSPVFVFELALPVWSVRAKSKNAHPQHWFYAASGMFCHQAPGPLLALALSK